MICCPRGVTPPKIAPPPAHHAVDDDVRSRILCVAFVVIMLIIGCCVCAGTCVATVYILKALEPQPQRTPLLASARQMYPMPQSTMVQLPLGVTTGQVLQVSTPNGLMQVTVPPGAQPGGVLQMT